MLPDNTNPHNFYEEYAATAQIYKTNESSSFSYYSFIKRVLDIVISILCMPIAILFIIVFAIIIKMETPGPVFYAQERVGLNGKYFKLLKLRSMRNDAEKNGATWASENDPRVTKIGSFMRKTRIDELPQLLNILKGDMTFIGPRPERPMFTAEFEKRHPGFVRRISVKPGLTGWAQINGGYDITPEEKCELDMIYIEHQNLKMDLTIIFKTIRIVLTGDGAR